MGSVRHGVRSTFGTLTGVIGWVVASLSLVNLFTSLFTIPLAGSLDMSLSIYRGIMHSLVGWMTVPFSIDLPAWARDVLVVYGTMGGVLVRRIDLYFPVKQAGHRALARALIKDAHNPKSDEPIRRRDWWVITPGWIRAPLITALWPAFLWVLFRTPFVAEEPAANGMPQRWSTPAPDRYDDRVAFGTTIAIIVVTAIGLILINIGTPQEPPPPPELETRTEGNAP